MNFSQLSCTEHMIWLKKDHIYIIIEKDDILHLTFELEGLLTSHNYKLIDYDTTETFNCNEAIAFQQNIYKFPL